MAQGDRRASAGVAIALPEPHASRLAAIVRQHTGADARAMTLEEAADRHAARIVITPEAVPAALTVWSPGAIAVVAGSRPVAESWRTVGVAVLTGPLPQPVVDWVRRVETGWEDEGWEWADDGWGWTEEEPDALPHSGARGRNASRVPAATSLGAASAHGQLVAVYSSGGGVGKTTTSVYLAAIAAERRHVVGVVELDEDRRGILTYWGRPARQGGLDSIKAYDWQSPDRLAEQLARIAVPVAPRVTVVPMIGTVSGLQYDVAQADQAVGFLTAWARRQFAWTFFDLPARVRDSTLIAVLKTVDRVVLVVEPTEIMLDSSRGYLDLLEQLGPDGAGIVPKMGLLVNKCEKHRAARLDPRAMAESLGVPLLGAVESNPAKYMSGINQHRIEPNSEWRSVATAVGIAGPDGVAAPVSSRPRLGWWTRRRQG